MKGVTWKGFTVMKKRASHCHWASRTAAAAAAKSLQ